MPPDNDDTPQAQDFDDWVREHYAALVASFAWVRVRGLDPHDVAHEALLIVNARLRANAIRSRASLFAYAKTVGANLVRTEFGPNGPAWRRRETLTAVPAAALVTALHALDPGDEVATSDTLARAFAALPVRQRAALLLAADDCSPAEIAAVLKLPGPRAAIALLHRARKAARAAYAAESGAADRDLCGNGSEGCVVPLTALVAGAMRSAARRFGWMPAPFVEPGAACVAAFTALSIVVVLGVPGPGLAGATPHNVRVQLGQPEAVDAELVPPARTAARRGQHGRSPSDHAAASASGRAVATPGGAAGTPRKKVTACVLVACIDSSSDDAPTGPTWPGDRYSIAVLGEDSPTVRQAVIPTCGYLSGQDVVRCEQGNGGYTVKEVPPTPAPAGAHAKGTTR